MAINLKLAAICCTYGRPELLANAIACFLAQDYPILLREMIVLDDAGQYDERVDRNVKIISMSQRYRTLGEKRNASAALVSPDVDAYCVWDDDDAYLPHHMSAAAEALSRVSDGLGFVLPARVFVERGRDVALSERPTGGIYHGGWSFHRKLFELVRGYPFIQSGQDQALKKLFIEAKCHTVVPDGPTSYIYRWGPWPHVSQRGVNYEGMPVPSRRAQKPLKPLLERDWTEAASRATRDCR